MAKELIIGPRFKKSKDNPNLLIHYVDKDHIIKEISLDVMSRQLLFTILKKPKKLKSKKKENNHGKKTMPRKQNSQ